MNKETGEIRELAEGEEPKPGEVTWTIGDLITSFDQLRLAKALLKGLRRWKKNLPPTESVVEIQTRIAATEQCIQQFEARR